LAPFFRPIGDALAVGGPQRVQAMLAFGPMPAPAHLGRALLVLPTHAQRWGTGQWITVDRIDTFQPGANTAGPPEVSPWLAAARVPLPSGPSRVLRIDITDEARNAVGQINLRVRVDGDAQVLLQSPLAADRNVRPRLELTLR
jgi:hypothetical protein